MNHKQLLTNKYLSVEFEVPVELPGTIYQVSDSCSSYPVQSVYNSYVEELRNSMFGEGNLLFPWILELAAFPFGPGLRSRPGQWTAPLFHTLNPQHSSILCFHPKRSLQCLACVRAEVLASSEPSGPFQFGRPVASPPFSSPQYS